MLRTCPKAAIGYLLYQLITLTRMPLNRFPTPSNTSPVNLNNPLYMRRHAQQGTIRPEDWENEFATVRQLLDFDTGNSLSDSNENYDLEESSNSSETLAMPSSPVPRPLSPMFTRTTRPSTVQDLLSGGWQYHELELSIGSPLETVANVDGWMISQLTVKNHSPRRPLII